MIVPAPYHREYDLWVTAHAAPAPTGNGSATTLPMTEEEMQAVVKHPIGFAPAEDDA